MSGVDNIAVLIVGDDRTARARTSDSLRKQTVVISIHGDPAACQMHDARYVVLVAAGVVLDPTACERAALFLVANRSAPYVTGASPRAPRSSAALSGVLDFLALRASDVHAVLGADFWHTIDASASGVPHLAFVLALSLIQRSGAGGWLADQIATDTAATPLRDQADALSRHTLSELSLPGEALVTEDHLSLPARPFQRLEPVAFPSLRMRDTEPAGLRILALFQGFPMGGYTAFNADLVPRLTARGHHVTTCTTEYWRTDWRLAEMRATAPDVHHAAAVVPMPSVPAYIEYLIKSRAIDVVLMSHSYLGYRLLPALRARFPQVAFVDYVHTDWFEAAMYGSYAMMSAQWSSHLDGSIASSKALAATMVADGADAERTAVAYIGIDTAAWTRSASVREQVRTALGIGPSSTLLLFAGRLSSEKRPLLAVDALQKLIAQGYDVRLVIAGGGPLATELKARIESLQLTAHAMVLGELEEVALRAVYAAADIYFAPSEVEGVARTLYEAMAMGAVPVVSDVGGQRELVIEGSGSLVQSPNGAVDDYLPALRHWMHGDARAAAAGVARRHVDSAMSVERTLHAIESVMSAAQTRRKAEGAAPGRHGDSTVAHELAVMALETIRRHVLRAARR
jgi:glycosyltransferase involved in cell wall biosynthesis